MPNPAEIEKWRKERCDQFLAEAKYKYENNLDSEKNTDSRVLEWYKSLVEQLGREPTLEEEDKEWDKQYNIWKDEDDARAEAEFIRYYGRSMLPKRNNG